MPPAEFLQDNPLCPESAKDKEKSHSLFAGLRQWCRERVAELFDLGQEDFGNRDWYTYGN